MDELTIPFRRTLGTAVWAQPLSSWAECKLDTVNEHLPLPTKASTRRESHRQLSRCPGACHAGDPLGLKISIKECFMYWCTNSALYTLNSHYTYFRGQDPRKGQVTDPKRSLCDNVCIYYSPCLWKICHFLKKKNHFFHMPDSNTWFNLVKSVIPWLWMISLHVSNWDS